MNKNKNIYLAFDVDGTLYDAGDFLVDAYKKGIINFLKSFDKKKIKIPTIEDIMPVLGMPVEEIFTRLFPNLNQSEKLELSEYCTKSEVEIIRKGGGRLFDGVAPVIESLHKGGYKILVASNGDEDYVSAILETFKLISYFSRPLLYVNHEFPDKSDIIRYYKQNVSKENLLIMIGDRDSDLRAAEVNDIPFIGCSFGHAGNEEIGRTKWIAKNFEEIPEILGEIENEY
ncbi:HAD family hydrolase [Spirochaetota bacterium]